MAGRPSTAIKLSEIDPQALAIELVGAVCRHVAKLSFHLAPQIQFHEKNAGDGLQWSDLGVTIQDLVHFAQTGDVSDWGDATGSMDAAQTVVETLFTPVFGEPSIDEVAGDADPKTPLGVVLLAAKGRAAILGYPWPGADHAAIPARELAALASVSGDAVYQLQHRGELPKTITPEVARAWLSGRGIAGFSEKH